MPERQIPWRTAAAELGGTFEFKTGLRSTSFHLAARIDDFTALVDGSSVPYSFGAGHTRIRVRAPKSFHHSLAVRHDNYPFGFLKRLGGRDVEVGDELFDAIWVVRAKSEAIAQAWFDAGVRDAINAIPASHSQDINGHPISHYYHFQVAGRHVTAETVGFEQDAQRLLQAVRAAVALAGRPAGLLEDWKRLAVTLEGRFAYRDRWRADGSTVVQMPVLGARVAVFPLAVHAGWRRRRLRTRILGERVSGTPQRFAVCRREQDDYLGVARGLRAAPVGADQVELLAEYTVTGESPLDVAEALTTPIARAIQDADPLAVWGTRREVVCDLDGHVLDRDRLMAAASAVATLVRGDARAAGPYR